MRLRGSRVMRNCPSVMARCSRTIFRGKAISWHWRLAMGRYAGGGIPLCPNALMDDGLFEVTILPALDRAARLDAYSDLLRHGIASIQNKLITTRTPWIEYQSSHDLHVNLDGEPITAKKFRVDLRHSAVAVRVGETAALQRLNK